MAECNATSEQLMMNMTAAMQILRRIKKWFS